MPFKDSKEGETHSQNDGCGEPAHNEKSLKKRYRAYEELHGYDMREYLVIDFMKAEVTRALESVVDDHKCDKTCDVYDCQVKIQEEAEQYKKNL